MRRTVRPIDIHKKTIIDYENELENKSHEDFCREYVRLDIEEGIYNKRARRIKAYRFSFPETIKDTDSVANSRATTLLNKKIIRDRIQFLYEEEGSSVENAYAWTRGKSEEVLISIALGVSKAGDKIKAVTELNKMRGIDKPVVDDDSETTEDTVLSFFNKVIKKEEK